MGASIVRRHHLDVDRTVASIDVVFNAHIRELDVPLVVAWKLVLPRPFLNLERAVRSAIAVVTISVSFLQELLVLALQIVFEDDAVDVRALITEVPQLAVAWVERLIEAVGDRAPARRETRRRSSACAFRSLHKLEISFAAHTGRPEQVADDEHGDGAIGGNHEGPEHSSLAKIL